MAYSLAISSSYQALSSSSHALKPYERALKATALLVVTGLVARVSLDIIYALVGPKLLTHGVNKTVATDSSVVLREPIKSSQNQLLPPLFYLPISKGEGFVRCFFS